MIEATLYDADGRDRKVELDEELISGLGEHQVLWVDVAQRDRTRLEGIAELLELGTETARRLERGPDRPRVDRYEGWILLSFLAIDMGAGATTGRGAKAATGAGASTGRGAKAATGAGATTGRGAETATGTEASAGRGAETTTGAEASQPARRDRSRRADIVIRPIDAVVGRNFVVTVHDGAIAAFDDFLDHVRGDTRLGELDAASFAAALIDNVLSGYLREVERIERRIDRLDEMALHAGDTPQLLDEIVALRRLIAALRGTLGPHRAAFAPLGRPDMEVEAVGKPWPGLVDRLDRAIDAVDSARDSLLGAFDIYMARAAQRTNEVMKVLTILNAILLPAVVLAGVMGMNFHPAFFDQASLFYVVVGAMLALAVGILGAARVRGWI